MKQIKIILSMAFVFFCFTAANSQSIPSSAKIAVDTTVYQCPMKCEGEKKYDKAGKCPKCGMNLKAKQKAVASIYQCPMKCEVDKTYDKPGKCAVCNMNLKKVEVKKEVDEFKGHNHK